MAASAARSEKPGHHRSPCAVSLVRCRAFDRRFGGYAARSGSAVARHARARLHPFRRHGTAVAFSFRPARRVHLASVIVHSNMDSHSFHTGWGISDSAPDIPPGKTNDMFVPNRPNSGASRRVFQTETLKWLAFSHAPP
jgi:hypothetical protein